MGIVAAAVLTLWVSTLAHTHPFLHNAPRALTTLATSASASASSPTGPLTHIADLRIKQQKAQKLQAEKQLAEEEDNATEEEEDVNNNEASPSLLQKKVYKILTKLKIISSISNGFSSNSNSTSAKLIDNSTKEREEVGEWDDEIENNVNSEESSTEDEPTFQKVIYPNANYRVPIKLRVPSERQVDARNDEEEGGGDKPSGRLEQIGVFFAELVGSIFGLVYGAAAQINNSIQGTTASRIEE